MKYSFAKKTEFSKELGVTGRQFLRTQTNGRYANKLQWSFMLITLFLFTVCYFLVVFSYVAYASVIGAVLIGFFCYMVVAVIGHDAAHQSISKSTIVNRVALFFSFSLIGISGSLWAKRHLRIHHNVPNVVGNGIDGDGSSILRFHDGQAWKPWHRFQAVYAPILYLVVLLFTAWGDDFAFLKKELQQSSRKKLMVFEFVATKLFHLCLTLGLPLLVFNSRPEMVLICYLIATMSASFLFVIFNIGTHINIHAEMINPKKDHEINHDWVIHQVKTTVNWSPENKFAGLLTGGVNAHLTHHLFPYAAHCHHAGLAKLVSNVSNKHSIKLNVVSFKEMVIGHFLLIKKLSKPMK